MKTKLIAMLCGAALCLGSAAQAQVNLNSSFTFDLGTSLYTYSYSVLNGGAFDLALVDVQVPFGPNAVRNLVAPAGFNIAYDSGLGLVSFLEDADPFTPQSFAPGVSVGAFKFSSAFAPGRTPFSSLDILGNATNGVTTGAVPEPATLGWGLALLAPVLIARPRRR